MSEFKGTKGKWEVTRESLCRLSIINGMIDVWSFQDEGLSSIEEMKANAQLIIKAPEMLEMLTKLHLIFEDRVMPTEQHLKTYSIEIKQLIKEATTI